MQKRLNILGLAISWFAIITQLVLMLENSSASMGITLIRFFSFLTILTNLLVALYFTVQTFSASNQKNNILIRGGSITAIATFIFIVGLVYQIALRNVWNPEGTQRLVDELLHTIIPLYFVLYWWLYSKLEDYRFKSVLRWIWFPIGYIVYTFIRGAITDEYPYPFLNVTEIGYSKAIGTSLMIFAFGIIIMFVLTFIGKELILKNRK